MVNDRVIVGYKRPSPEALLARVQAAGQGRLKIFLGAAPGVGKTYQMLISGRTKQAEGWDVVIGVVETHGRRETAALVEGMEIVPRRSVSHGGQPLEEMNLDAILARRPRLVLVDELAHSNAPESRHPKRWQDVEELLAAGIDVYTTVNIQHVESLNDVVTQITRVRVRETVPDHILDRADDIEVIDLTPDDLIARLKDGKVYVPGTAERALENFFSPGNLTALRELALRRTAQRVDAQLLNHMQSHAISGPWAAGDRVIVCVSEDLRAAGLVRYAKRLADRLRAPFTALSVETGRSTSLPDADRDRIAQTLRLAERLGGEAVTIPGGARRIADDVIGFAREQNVTHIVIGKSSRSRWFELLHGSVVHDLVRRAGDISVHVIAGETPAASVRAAAFSANAEWRRAGGIAYAAALATVAASLGFAKLVQPVFGVEAIDLIFLTGVVAIAIQFGLYPSLFAVVAASLAYNFFFLPPIYTFTIADPTNIASLVLFTLVAVLVSNLAARVRLQAQIARGRARTTEALYGFSRKLTSCTSLDDILWATAFQIASLLSARVVLLLPDARGMIAVKAGYPPEDEIGSADVAAAKVAYDSGKPAGRGADTLPGAKRLFLPLRTGRGVIGVVGLDGDGAGPLLTPEQRRLFDALADQAALAIQQVQLLEDLDRARLDAETDRLRQALLTSISHDLRTPLASIIGATATMRDYRDALDEPTKAELLASVHEEAERLNRFVVNLLDMTRLEAGAVRPNRSANEIAEVVGSALRRAEKVLAGHRIALEIDGALPMVDIDPVLFEQVLFNLLDNAVKYAPIGTTVRVAAHTVEGGRMVELNVIDEGEGIMPLEDAERIFDKFYRAGKGDRVRPGTGLGLAVCRGFVEAMGGTIVAANRADARGAVFTIRLPAAPSRAMEPA